MRDERLAEKLEIPQHFYAFRVPKAEAIKLPFRRANNWSE
jgi:hypothetical protein